jgi:hypothetical protein
MPQYCVYYGLKSSIFVEADVLLTTGGCMNQPDEPFFISNAASYFRVVQTRADARLAKAGRDAYNLKVTRMNIR